MLTSCVLVIFATAAAGAQAGVSQGAKPDADKAVAISGCLSGSPGAFVLTNVSAANTGDAKDRPVGTAGLADAYSLQPRGGVALDAHVGHRVQLVGVVVEPGTKPDAPTKAKGPTAQFAVTAVKMISPVCIE